MVEGTNAGFVTTAPTSNPEATNGLISNYRAACKFTAPAGAVKITEMGWYCSTAVAENDFDIGVYTHDSGNDKPDARLHVDADNAKGTTEGWKKVTGLNWAVTGGTVYWLAIQLDATVVTYIDYTASQGIDEEYVGAGVANLPDPWGTSTGSFDRTLAIYALYTTVTAKSQLILITE